MMETSILEPIGSLYYSTLVDNNSLIIAKMCLKKYLEICHIMPEKLPDEDRDLNNGLLAYYNLFDCYLQDKLEDLNLFMTPLSIDQDPKSDSFLNPQSLNDSKVCIFYIFLLYDD